MKKDNMSNNYQQDMKGNVKKVEKAPYSKDGVINESARCDQRNDFMGYDALMSKIKKL